ncbi:MAG: hypothetical protein HY481_00030 [Candidatus Vogelbacteria bacterium]|nr:hypothetical protein [Candidatus Vogelbacteria bacterium]
MKKLIWLIIVAVLAFVLYRAFREEPQQPLASTTPIMVRLAAENSSGETGQAVLTEVDGQVKMTIEMSGVPKDLPQPAHLHKGTCEVLGEPIYTLSSVLNGASETTLPVSLAAITDKLPLALNVHKSAAEMNVYVACGEVTNG